MGPLQKRAIGPSQATSASPVARRLRPLVPANPRSRGLAHALASRNLPAKADESKPRVVVFPRPDLTPEPSPQLASTPARRVARVSPFGWLGLGAVVVSIGAVVVLQVATARHELNALQREAIPSVVRPTAVGWSAAGPEFHVEEPPHGIELASPEFLTSVDPVLPAPASHSSEGVTDLISLA